MFPLRVRISERCNASLAWLAVFLFVGVSSAGVARAGTDALDRVAVQAELGARAPVCELESLSPAGGFETLRSRSFAGRTVLVDFWASWCPTCGHAFPFLNQLVRDYRDQGFEVIGVNLDSDPRDALDFLAVHPVEFEIARDPTGHCPRGFGLVGMPSAYLIDADGRVRAVTRGFRAGEAQGLRSRIESLLVKAPVGSPNPALARTASPSQP